MLRLLVLVLLALCEVQGDKAHTVLISGGEFTPQYGTSTPTERFMVASFRIDSAAVTNQQYYSFIKRRKEWQRNNTSPLMADENYLKHWLKISGAFRPPKQQLDAPVVNVSWFAANDYCTEQGGRLPSVLEWEYVAAASEHVPNASSDPEFVQRLLDWYGKPHPGGLLPSTWQGRPNYWGVYNLHGLIWEWNSDFNSVFVAGDNRRDGEQLKNLFCGNSAASAADRANYAAFMRYALRNSLKASYTMESLGFRCAFETK